MKDFQSTKLLNNLLQYLHDSQSGYQSCSTAVNDPKMVKLFNALAEKRTKMVQELSEKINNLEAQPTESGTATGAMHRLFVNLKSLITQGNIDSIINEIKRGENTLIQQYKDILREDIPEDIHLLLTAQLDEIDKDLTEIDQLSAKP